VIWVNREAEYFLQRDWTGRNSLIRLEKLDFTGKSAGRTRDGPQLGSNQRIGKGATEN
jgi:hypothetical protein